MRELEDRIVRFVARCVKVCAAVPMKAVVNASFADQLFRSPTSIAANYAEACEAESAKDFVHKLKVAMKELSETRIWLRLIAESGYIENAKLADLVGESRKLSRILSASVETTRKRLEAEMETGNIGIGNIQRVFCVNETGRGLNPRHQEVGVWSGR